MAADQCPAFGDVVELVGLKARPDLNGTFAVVIEAESAEESAQLETAGRLKVTSYPNTLSLKPANLRGLSKEEEAEIDWSFMDGDFPGLVGKPTVRAMISHPSFFLGEKYKGAEVVEQVWTLITKGGPKPPIRYISDLERRAILNNTAVHSVYFLELDLIAHHLIIETRGGRGRVYQCFVESAPDEHGDQFGFSVREWTTGAPDDPSDPLVEGVLAARSRWGGDDPISRKTMSELLDLLSGIQQQGECIASSMQSQIPESATANGKSLYNWSEEIAAQPANLSLSVAKDDGRATVVSSNERFEGTPFSFTIPSDITEPFVESYKELIGYAPQAVVYLAILHHCSATGQEPKGFGLRALTIPH